MHTELKRNPHILFYDGDCLLCSRSIQWIMRKDPEGKIRYAPLQGILASEVLPVHVRVHPGSVILMDRGRMYKRSGAVFRIFHLLGGGWKALSLLRFMPPAISDLVYLLIARNRKKWFKGKPASCAPEYKDRILM